MKIRVLFLASNPKNLTQLALETEVKEIREKIQASEFGDEIEIVPHWKTTPDDLIQLFLEDDDWTIVHYSGHGSKSHEILLVDDHGQAKPVSKKALQRVFSSLGKKARVVVFNSCWAEGQADAVTEHIDCSIGMSRVVGDAAAILFAASFYRAIGFGKSIQQAFDQGLLAIDLEGIAEVDTPQLRCRDGFDPTTVHLLSSKTPYRVEDEWTRLAPAPPDLDLVAGQEWHAFLSYRSVNRAWVLNLHDVLQHHGYRLFLDQFAIQPGTSLVGRLEEGLQKSRTGVLIWSSANADSAWCISEYETMQQRRASDPSFTFVTLRLADELPLMAQKDVWIDFSDYPDGPNGGGLLKLLFALAEKPLTPQALAFANNQDEEGRQAELAIKAAIDVGNPRMLIDLFERGGVAWNSSATLGAKVADALTRLGEYEKALSILESVHRRFPRSVRPKQLRALALARRAADGDLEEAQHILAMLRADGQQDPETLGIYGRTWMDRYGESGKEIDLRKSRNLYAEAFEHAPDDTYTGINAAAKSVLLGELEKGREYAQQVVDVLKERGPSDYWERATLAEGHMILGQYELGAQEYADAVTEASTQKGSLAVTWKQAQLLRVPLKISDKDWEPIAKAFKDV